MGVYCGIDKSSYNISNISYLISPPPPLFFIPPSPNYWNSFNSLTVSKVPIKLWDVLSCVSIGEQILRAS
jgi:hypothetical protein